MTNSRKGRLLYLLLVLLLLLSLPVSAQDSATQPAFEWDTLNELAARIAEDMQLPGVALAWVRPAEEPHIGIAGLQAAGGNEGIEPSDRFHIAPTSTALLAIWRATALRISQVYWERMAFLKRRQSKSCIA